MLKLAFVVLVEVVVGLAVAAIVLAVGIPVMMRRELIAPGDLTGSFLIAGVLLAAVGGMLLRPGSAINRYGKRDE